MDFTCDCESFVISHERYAFAHQKSDKTIAKIPLRLSAERENRHPKNLYIKLLISFLSFLL